MKNLLKIIDSTAIALGKTAAWLAAALVALISLEIILRNVFTSPTAWNYETVLMTAGAIYGFGWYYAQRLKVHIRVDVIYNRFSPRVRAGIDTVSALIFFFPLIGLFAYVSVKQAVTAFVRHEVSTLSYWYPPLGPIRTVIALAFILLFIQGLAQFIRDCFMLVRNKSYD